MQKYFPNIYSENTFDNNMDINVNNADTFYTTLEGEIESSISKQLIYYPVNFKDKHSDRSTDIELYTQNTSRWKIKFEEPLLNRYKHLLKVLSLLEAIKKPSMKHILKRQKFISVKIKTAALTLYVHYLYHDLKSATFDNKQLAKRYKRVYLKQMISYTILKLW